MDEKIRKEVETLNQVQELLEQIEGDYIILYMGEIQSIRHKVDMDPHVTLGLIETAKIDSTMEMSMRLAAGRKAMIELQQQAATPQKVN